MSGWVSRSLGRLFGRKQPAAQPTPAPLQPGEAYRVLFGNSAFPGAQDTDSPTPSPALPAFNLEIEPEIGPGLSSLALSSSAIETVEIDPPGIRTRCDFLQADSIDTELAQFGNLFDKPEFKSYRNAGLTAVRLRDLAVIGTDAVVLHAGKVIPDTLVHVMFWTPHSSVAAFQPRASLRLKTALPMQRRLSGRPYFVGFAAGWPNYAHWMQQTLPMLTAYVSLRGRMPELQLVVPAFKPGSFQEQTLRLLGIDAGQIEAIAPGELLGIDDGFSMTLPDIWSVPHYVSEAAAILSATVPPTTSNAAQAHSKRVYLHRDVQARRVLNFDAVSEVLIRHGFEVVSFEQAS